MSALDEQSILISEAFSEEEKAELVSRLWELLKRQAAKYAGCDSSSLSIERAEALLESLSYTVLLMYKSGVPKESILRSSPDALLKRGQVLLRSKQSSALNELRLTLRDMPDIKNAYLYDTLRGLGSFFKKYDVIYEAHCIPCSIDYKLLCPVSEELKGVSYIEEYITSLHTEFSFLRSFDALSLKRLYTAYVGDYVNAYFNLCEPVLTNALGLCLLGKKPQTLGISDRQRDELLALTKELSYDELSECFREAQISLYSTLGIAEKEKADYFSAAVSDLPKRVFEAKEHSDLSGIFI